MISLGRHRAQEQLWSLILGMVLVMMSLAPSAQAQAARDAAMTELARSLAVDAALWGSPLVIMYNLRYNDAVGPQSKAAPNSIWRQDNISTPKLAEEAGYVSPNVNTVYGFGFLDLGPQPIILSVPDSNGRYYMVQIIDMWTNAFAYAGGVETGYKGGTFALVGPGWKGVLPPNVNRIDCPTRWVLVQPRVHVRDSNDLASAEKVLQAITVTGLAKFSGTQSPKALAYNYESPIRNNSKLPVSAMNFEDPLQFWDILSAAMNENPPPEDQVKALLPMFALLGLELGKTWDRSKMNPIVLNAMRNAAMDIGQMLSQLPRRIRNGWRMPPRTIGNFGTDYLTRAYVARIGLTSNTPREAIYYMAMVDSESNRELTGTNRYTVTFKETPPTIAPGFWSMTMYDAANNYTAPNPINRYSLGSDNMNMKLNPDGSLTIFIQRDSPGLDKEANWLPSPSGPFYLVLRSYVPGEAMVSSLTDPTAYTPPTISEIK